MEKLANLSKAIDAKVQLLNFTKEATVNIARERDITAVERQRKTLENKIEEVHRLKVEIQELNLKEAM